MFGSTILDVAIGIVFIYLLVSLVISATNELIAALLKSRAKNLSKGIQVLLQDLRRMAGLRDFMNIR